MAFKKGDDVYLLVYVEHTTYVGDMVHCVPVYQEYRRDTNDFIYPGFSDSIWDVDKEHPYRYYLRDLDVRMFASSPDVMHCNVEYMDVHRADVNQIQAMARTLKGIHRKLDKYKSEFGRPQTFGAYCARFAKAIGACGFVFKVEDYYYNGIPEWNTDKYKTMSIEEGTHQADVILKYATPDR